MLHLVLINKPYKCFALSSNVFWFHCHFFCLADYSLNFCESIICLSNLQHFKYPFFSAEQTPFQIQFLSDAFEWSIETLGTGFKLAFNMINTACWCRTKNTERLEEGVDRFVFWFWRLTWLIEITVLFSKIKFENSHTPQQFLHKIGNKNWPWFFNDQAYLISLS